MLSGIEAAIWSLLTLRCYPYQQLLSLVAALMDLPELEAEHRLRLVLKGWQSCGLLVSTEPADG